MSSLTVHYMFNNLNQAYELFITESGLELWLAYIGQTLAPILLHGALGPSPGLTQIADL